METIYLGIVVFLLLLAVFDIVVGVSNDAVNFINSAIGSKAAQFRTIIIVSAVGVFAGAALSNGMMDIARHGIFSPSYFSFYDVMCIFLAVMVTDVVLLDVFNTLGMPTSTTVSMVFELLGGAFALAMMKIVADDTGLLGFGDLLNTDKALSVIMGIFLSVAIAFFFGYLVQWLARLLFSFAFNKRTRVRQGIFAGVSTTALIYFLLIKGLKGSTLMTGDVKAFVDDNTLAIVAICLVVSSVIMVALSYLKVNVLKIVVLLGTFALAMAFAGNDLVNFIGVPLAGLSSYQDFVVNGSGSATDFMMHSLNESAKTPFAFLAFAGIVMVVALSTSKKAQNVVKTSVGLSRQDDGDEMFGSSALARSIVRNTVQASRALSRFVPQRVSRWVDARFDSSRSPMPDGAAFDLLRAAVNLVLAGLLVALGTSLELPLSTTYVTFMVAMGTSLADRAWGRESAVFRITGVVSVIGGWFITAGVAFVLCFLVAVIMHFGGAVAMLAFIAIAIAILIRSNMKFTNKCLEKDDMDECFNRLMKTKDHDEALQLVSDHNRMSNQHLLEFVKHEFVEMTDAFFREEYRRLKRLQGKVEDERKLWKRLRRREIVGMRRIDPVLAIEKNTWFFLGSNACEQMLYCMKRVVEPCVEHIGNNFVPVAKSDYTPYIKLRDKMEDLFAWAISMYETGDYAEAEALREKAQQLQSELSDCRKEVIDRLQQERTNVSASLAFVNILQETQELVGSLRHLMRGTVKLSNPIAFVRE